MSKLLYILISLLIIFFILFITLRINYFLIFLVLLLTLIQLFHHLTSFVFSPIFKQKQPKLPQLLRLFRLIFLFYISYIYISHSSFNSGFNILPKMYICFMSLKNNISAIYCQNYLQLSLFYTLFQYLHINYFAEFFCTFWI